MYRVVVLEGIDGVGKTRLAYELAADQTIKETFDRILVIREPFDYDVVKAKHQQEILKSNLSNFEKAVKTIFLFSKDREVGYKDLLCSVKTTEKVLILADRSYYSTLAYNIPNNTDETEKLILEDLLSSYIHASFRPDLAFLLLAKDFETLVKMSANKKAEDDLDSFDIKHKQSIQENYLKYFNSNRFLSYFGNEVFHLEDYIRVGSAQFNYIVNKIVGLK